MTHTSDNKIGRFMVAIGAVIEHETTSKILIVNRNDEFHKDEWEIIYGRIDQFEDLDTALKREVFEETRIDDLEIKQLLRIWHMYRGQKSIDNDLFGFTFHCTTKTENVQLSSEHSEYRWVTPTEAIDLLEQPGIKVDVELFSNKNDERKIIVSDPEQKVRLSI